VTTPPTNPRPVSDERIDAAVKILKRVIDCAAEVEVISSDEETQARATIMSLLGEAAARPPAPAASIMRCPQCGVDPLAPAAAPQAAGEGVSEAEIEESTWACPFCGGLDIDPCFAKASDGTVAAGCMDCGATGPDGQADVDAATMTAWRQRALVKQIESLRALLATPARETPPAPVSAAEIEGAIGALLNATFDAQMNDHRSEACNKRVADAHAALLDLFRRAAGGNVKDGGDA
jgi:predicted RNA-binding Zn-ribbon protein involved in translation (DUF1610 family)